MPLPRAIIQLQPDGLLALVLTGADGTERPAIPIRRPEVVLDVLRRILQAQALGEVRLGSDGNPSLAQAKCFAEHSGGYADANCPWCRAGGRFVQRHATGAARERAATASQPWSPRGDGVKVRRIAPGITGAQYAAAQARGATARDPRVQPKSPALQRQSTRSAEDLGL